MADNFNISDQDPGVTIPDARGIFTEGEWGYVTAAADAKFSEVGVYGDMEVQDKNELVIVDATGSRFQTETDNKAGEEAFIRTSGALHQLDQKLLFVWKFLLDTNASVRWFLGLHEAQATSPVASDNIGDPAVGLIFSTSRPDTNFQFVAHDGAVQTLVDTGIAVDTAPHFVKIDANAAGTSTLIELRDTDFVLQASTTFTTEGPGPAIELNSQEWILGLTGTVLQSLYYGTAVARNA